MGQRGMLVLASLCVLLIYPVHAQVVSLITIADSPWRYYEEGREPINTSQPGISWKAPEFNDATWPQGLGSFGFEETPLPTPIQTPLLLTAPGAQEQTRTYYFRTHFTWNHGPNAYLWFTNLLDDGAVVYLNGSEIYRYRIIGTPTYATLASSALMEGRYEITNVSTRGLRTGDNVLAVELHQAGMTSADVVFGLALAGMVPEPVVITKQPESVGNIIYGKRFELSVEATGSDLRYRWYFNGSPLSAGTNATLSMIANFQTGTFHVMVTNIVGSVRSSNAVVRTIPDTFGPRILSAVVPTGETNRMYVYFDEDLLRVNQRNVEWSATNVLNYVITDTVTDERMDVAAAVPAVGLAAVRLTFAQNFDPESAYEICLYNISDTRTNQIAMNSCVPVGFELATHVFTFGSNWQFYDWLDAPPANWNDPDYIEDPGLWGFASALFYNDQAGDFNPPCTFRSTAVSLGPTAYYFRKRFMLPTNMLSVPVSAMLGRVLDDGAVFYLNGTELFRTNMPAGPVNHRSFALASGNPNLCSSNQMNFEFLLRVTNVLAVEVHQFGESDYDMAFDASLLLKHVVTPVLTNREPAGDVFLRYSNHSPTELRLYWTNGMGFALEYVHALGDFWRELQPPSTNVLVEKNGSARFYRLNKRH